jgi:hypothetical protein
MMETRYLVAYREGYDGWWHDFCGCDHLDCCQELADSGARAKPDRQYAVFANQPQWWMGLPQYTAGLSDRELYHHSFGEWPEEHEKTAC